MQRLIQILINRLQTSNPFMENVDIEEGYYFRRKFPVAVVHHQKRVKEDEVVICLKNMKFFNTEGYTPHNYDEEMLRSFSRCTEKYLKSVSLMCFSSAQEEGYLFKEKRMGDYWKKIINPGNFKAVIEYSHYNEGDELCKIEFDLRELMRSSKEVPSLKILPYVWVVRLSLDVDITKIMQHYFNKNFKVMMQGKETLAIGWSNTLQEVNMRYFVCQPEVSNLTHQGT